MTTRLLFFVRDNNAASLNYALSPTTGVALSTGMIVSALKEKGLDTLALSVTGIEDI